ncbi:MAG TPA: DUF6544 family protein [Christiangramia sp.]|nr:DUF6544 family protein [Christiangramia sp.]
MRLLFTILLFLHLLIHSIGFAKAFHWIDSSGETMKMSGAQGFLCLLVSILLLLTIYYFHKKNPIWILLSILVIIISQVVILFNWDDAKYGSIINLIILIVAIISIAGWKFENKFREDKVRAILSSSPSNGKISNKDIEHLPLLVQKYIISAGFLGEPKIDNVLIRFTGEMREKGKKWFKFRSEQFNVIQDPSRFFFMKAIFKGIPTKGYHRYDGKSARMTIKPLSIFRIIDISSEELLLSEMVTYLNDICIFAPGALIGDKFTWEEDGENTVKVNFTNNGRTVSAILEINNSGQLINFFSRDRYAVNDTNKYLFSTPVGGYQTNNKFNLATYGEAIWHYPDEEFVYGKFDLMELLYNFK